MLRGRLPPPDISIASSTWDTDPSSLLSALRPWHARSFVDSAVQRLSVALQRSIQRDQILRSHLRRGKRGNDAAPDGYYGGCGDGGYESGAASSSSSDGGGGVGGFGVGEHSAIRANSKYSKLPFIFCLSMQPCL